MECARLGLKSWLDHIQTLTMAMALNSLSLSLIIYFNRLLSQSMKFKNIRKSEHNRQCLVHIKHILKMVAIKSL